MNNPPFITLERHIQQQQEKHPEASGIFSGVLTDVALAAKVIGRELILARFNGDTGYATTRNIHGETQQKLDLFADGIIQQICGKTRRLYMMISEEQPEAIMLPDNSDSKYILVYDPLDGSANISANVGVGTIFAIYRRLPQAKTPLEHLHNLRENLACAGYVVYGPSTAFVYSTGQGVFCFTLDPTVGEFLLTQSQLQIPEPPRYYSANQGYEKWWSTGVQQYMKWLQGFSGDQKPLSARYTGSLVVDFHRNLLAGGVFCYPAEHHPNKAPLYKLRLIYESVPLAFIAEQAGGAATDGLTPILDITPSDLHQRVPLFIGSKTLVEHVRNFIDTFDVHLVR
jgi:fructose-1,6-bisphosphatase I